jgi:hypothetical protein
MEMSIVEKVELEEKVKKHEARQASDIEYLQNMELQTHTLNDRNGKLEN